MDAAKNYWVATQSADGRPHCMPVWGVWLDEELVFSTGPTTRKARNLGSSPFASVHLESGDELVVIEGPTREVRDTAELERFLAAYNPKYAWDFRLDQLTGGGVFAVSVAKAFAWLGSDHETFSGTATRWVFDEGAENPEVSG